MSDYLSPEYCREQSQKYRILFDDPVINEFVERYEKEAAIATVSGLNGCTVTCDQEDQGKLVNFMKAQGFIVHPTIMYGEYYLFINWHTNNL